MKPMDSASQWIVLARILRPQGRRGEVLADLFTDFPERFHQHSRVWFAAQGFADSPTAEFAPVISASDDPPPADKLPASQLQIAEIASHWLPVGRNAGRIVLRFSGIDTIEQAEKLTGFEVLVPRAERMSLDPGSAYISDLIGCTVYDRDKPLGVVAGVDFPTTPDGARHLDAASPLLVLTSPSGDEILIPFARAFLLALDPAAKSIRMSLPEGLAELNLQNSTQTSTLTNRAAER
jgi:16S rRNA processing protein RimM